MLSRVSEKLIRVPAILAKLSCSRRTFARLRARFSDFPRPLNDGGPGVPVWREFAIDSWIVARDAEVNGRSKPVRRRTHRERQGA